MLFEPKFLGACLIGAVFIVATAYLPAPRPIASSAPQDGRTAGTKEAITLDESVFVIKEDQPADYYARAEEKLQAEMIKIYEASRKYEDLIKMKDRIDAYGKAADAAYKKILKGTLNADDASEKAKANALSSLTLMLAENGKTDELVALIKRFKDSESKKLKSIADRDVMFLGGSVAAGAKDVDELLASLKSWGEKEKDLFSPTYVASGAVRAFCNRLADEGRGDELEKLINLYKDSEDEELKKAVTGFDAKLRFAKLVGNEMIVEGLYLDKTEIDWNSYRGKVVLVGFWDVNSPLGGEIPYIKKLYEKYHAAGFEVLGYGLDFNLDSPEKDKERRHPWRTASRKLSTEAKNDKGEPVYKDLIKYYEINPTPQMVLVGRDGKVISTKARGAELKRLLEEQFPDVK
ncbi:MAG: hypothetical protein II807_06970 [Thermoguttaceae bacterium]|nr:hypothetical protein [Thermoguttaceae bacterium]